MKFIKFKHIYLILLLSIFIPFMTTHINASTNDSSKNITYSQAYKYFIKNTPSSNDKTHQIRKNKNSLLISDQHNNHYLVKKINSQKILITPLNKNKYKETFLITNKKIKKLNLRKYSHKNHLRIYLYSGGNYNGNASEHGPITK
ncbi:hypothetical protein [Apilactobacillus xinyiensis]|uniref:hypothetical protein n=1 Tax=Apilactobacillus xinyiensis TaxID=2841032 RepID=UPI00200EDAF7|nr:hypothetical protein [Apilactobacillus xinyiensis]MCL0329737.1 hypothetical protein [Apilactobacillus xinyiensis]